MFLPAPLRFLEKTDGLMLKPCRGPYDGRNQSSNTLASCLATPAPGDFSVANYAVCFVSLNHSKIVKITKNLIKMIKNELLWRKTWSEAKVCSDENAASETQQWGLLKIQKKCGDRAENRRSKFNRWLQGNCRKLRHVMNGPPILTWLLK